MNPGSRPMADMWRTPPTPPLTGNAVSGPLIWSGRRPHGGLTGTAMDFRYGLPTASSLYTAAAEATDLGFTFAQPTVPVKSRFWRKEFFCLQPTGRTTDGISCT